MDVTESVKISLILNKLTKRSYPCQSIAALMVTKKISVINTELDK